MKHKVNKKVFRRTLSLVLVLAMLVTGFNLDVKVESVYATQKAEKTEDNGEIKDYIIVAKNEKAYNRALNATGEEAIKNGEKFIDNNIIVAELSEQEAEELNEDSNIIIEEDLKVKANVKAKPRTISKNKGIDRDVAWNLQMINADKANINSNQKVKVAIIDSGVDAISGIKVKERINLVDDKEDNLLFFEDYSGHGTSVAGIIAGSNGENNVEGINPNVELYSAKVLDDNNVAPISRVIEGIYWAIEQDVDIINLSLGTTVYSEALEKAIKDAYAENIILVASAGNTGIKIEYPAAFKEVIAVGGVNSKGEVSKSSVIGKEIELMAPGEMIKVVGPFGGLTAADGTSMAAPHVTAVAAVLLGIDKNVSNDFVRQLMNASAKELIESGTGYGIVDLKYAIDNYDVLRNQYDNGNLNVKIIENNEEIHKFNEEDLVEARWWQEEHQYLVQLGYDSNNVYLEDWEINRIKYGATKIDEIFPSNYGKSDDSSFLHGYKNYVANYIYLTHAAYEIYNDGYNRYLNGTTTVAGAKVAGIKDRISRFPWPSYADTNWEKSLIVFGMALHVIGDAYAHKAYGYQNGAYVNINHTDNWNTNADNTTYFAERELGARSSTIKAMKRYFDTRTVGNYKQFVHNNYSTYKLHKLYTYCNKTTESEGGSVASDATLLRNASYGD